MGTVITSRGTFDMSLANDVWSDENDEDPDTSEETRTLDQDASAGLHTPNVPRTSTSRAVGRPKDNRGAQSSQISPRDPPHLTRDPNKAAQDAAEARTKRKTSSNRLGGADLRILRANIEELGGSTPNAKGKRNSTDSSSQSGTYTANKRIRAKKRMQLLEKELQDIEAKQSLGGNEMMGLLMFMREESNRRADLEDKRRREDRAERLAVEKAEREERERIRRDEANAQEQRRLQDLNESRTRHDQRLAQDREEARQRHEQTILLISSLHRGKKNGD
ncbi:hypothetical protein GN958_ATG15387 [Phytophthora infestans]|uniref:Uncharacterized protein n=1 Tax=Phytophthora infestans TaxID=4787 RepID=A0A8S9U380_PHYIN|nr:hypothetical protein GN958_ATG15387 [Phytophthora infestans]